MIKKLLFLSALFFALHAQAQDSTKRKQLDEVIVTATKFSLKSSETGKVVTVIDRATIDRSLGKDISQLLTEQAGIIVNSASSNPGKDKSIFLRGAKNDYIVILMDGIPLTDPSGVGGAFDLRMLPLEQIERIEILKGAASTLYGSDAVAGVINIITRKGGGKPAQFNGNLSFGSFGTVNSNLGLSGTAEKVSYNLGFSHYETDGFSEAIDTTGSKNFDKDGFLRNTFSFHVDGEVTKGFHIKPFVNYSFAKGNFDSDAFTDADARYRSSLLNTGTSARYQFNGGSVTAQYQFGEVFRSYSTYGGSEFKGKTHHVDVYGSFNVGRYVQVLAGFDHRTQKMYDTTATPKDPEIKISSPYLALFLKNLGGFNLEAGVRYNDHSKFGDRTTYSINPSVLLGKNVKLFVNIASAFKSPPLTSLYGKYGANAELKPEFSKSYEAGVQTSFFSDLLEFRGVVFKRDMEDVIVYGPAFQLINLNEQKDRGVEIEPTINITKDLQVKLWYSFLEGEVTTATKTPGKDTSYNNLIRRPKHSFGATIGYQVTKNLYVSTNVYNYGKRDDIYFDPLTYAQVPVSLKAFLMWNAYAEYKLLNNRLRIFADVKNITNAKYAEVYGYNVAKTNINAGIAVRL